MLKQYKCPCCDGAIEWNAEAQSLKCPFCKTEFEIGILESYQNEIGDMGSDEMNWEEAQGSSWQEGEKEGLRVYSCKSCGGEIIGDENMGAATCPYCGNSSIVPSQFEGDLRPDFVIPFKKTKDEAKAAYRNHLKDKKFLPNVFGNENHIDEIKGIYVPFWLYGAQAETDAKFKGIKSREWKDRDYEYKEEKHYLIVRKGVVGFENVSVDGSGKIDDDLMESIEPFDFSELKAFSPEYLSGYFADRYDVKSQDCEERANTRVKNTAEKMIKDTVKDYDDLETKTYSMKLKDSKAQYALCPVWLLNTTWQGKKYTFAMNGQTGKFVGDLPADEGSYKKALIGNAAVIAAIVFAALSAAWFFM